MNKILAIAIATAFAAPAFAATSNVDIYGTLSVSVDRVDGDGVDGSRTRVSSNNSNFGFKGAEDLGGGLSAVWQFEQAIALDQQSISDNTNSDTAGTQSRRNTFAGLSSKTLGALTIGAQESPMKTSVGKLDLFTNTIADYRTLMGPQTRGINSVLYASPVFSGVSGKLMYSARNEDGKTDDADYWSGNVTYENGPFFAALAHEREGVQANAVTFAAATGTAAAVLQVNAANTDQKTTRLGFGYKFGDAKIGLGYNTTKLENNLTSAETKVNTWMLNGAYAMGNVTLKAQYLKAGDTKGNAIADEGASQFALGADYALSKRTGLYALYTKLNNDTKSFRKLGNNSGVTGANTGISTVSPNLAGQDPTAFSIGMIHKF